jgi:tetratricopeptide (TPR) repeat protein
MNLHLIYPTLLFILLLLLTGCQLLERKKPLPASANPNSIDIARQMEAKGRYGQAIAVLEEAIAKDGKAQSYTEILREIRLQQNIVEQELEDQLLISRTAALKNQIPILEQLKRSDPDQEEYAEQLNETRQQLLRLRRALSECGWRHFKKNNTLAKDCLTLALSLEQNEQDERLMAYLVDEHRQNLQKTQTVEMAKRKMAWKHRNQQRLEEARRLYETGQLKESRRVLKVILKEHPRNSEAKKLLRNAESRLKRYIENLLSAGDRLYREGEIEGAKATWRAALSIDPQDPRAREKIERAQRVLDNLENLRKSEPRPPSASNQSVDFDSDQRNPL